MVFGSGSKQSIVINKQAKRFVIGTCGNTGNIRCSVSTLNPTNTSASLQPKFTDNTTTTDLLNISTISISNYSTYNISFSNQTTSLMDMELLIQVNPTETDSYYYWYLIASNSTLNENTTIINLNPIPIMNTTGSVISSNSPPKTVVVEYPTSSGYYYLTGTNNITIWEYSNTYNVGEIMLGSQVSNTSSVIFGDISQISTSTYPTQTNTIQSN